MLVLAVSLPSYSQCVSNVDPEGGTVVPIANFPQTVNVGSGTYVSANVHIGGIYTFDHCASSDPSWGNSQITIISTTAVLSYSNSGSCGTGTTASATWTANNTYTVEVRPNVFNCVQVIMVPLLH